jgi:CheY-like chemotaxis protein/HPt (histidine-containing phosphotransfer) domain-containing protein
MGHEIRTPMNGIIGATGLLQQMHLSVEQLEYIRIIRESSELLASLIQNILDFTRLDSGQLELDEIEFDLRDTIQNTVAMLGGQARAKCLTLTGYVVDGIPPRVIGDPARVRQILVNLIGNGIKFTESGGVTVDAQLMSMGESSVTIGVIVNDTGIGIEAESVPRLFSMFNQVDGSISRRFGGTGLGLAICKNLVGLMGGAIEVDSMPGQGSTFRFTMRLRRAAATDPGQSSVGVAPGRHLKVLLVEDNPTNRHVAMRMLTRMGHEVDAVEDGARAISAVAAADYDVVLMDIMMPDVDGLAATRAIRAGAPPRRDTFIIGLTANAAMSDRAACMAAGMNDFVAKPVTMERLRAALEQSAIRKLPPSGRDGPEDAEFFDAAFLGQLCEEIGTDGVIQMIRIFLEDAPLYLLAIRRAAAEGAVQIVRREAHGLAGAARAVGLARLASVTEALHRSCEWSGPGKEETETVATTLRDSLPLVANWADARATPVVSAA